MEELFDPAGPEFWVLVATVIFLLIVWKVGGFRQLTGALDRRAQRIQAELEEAKALREEAEKLLAEYARKGKEAEAEAKAIIAAAKEEAERYKVESVAKVQEFVARRTRMAEQKIGQAEAQAVAEVRSAASDAAVQAAETILGREMAGASAGKILDAALAEVRSKLN
jgi:F-type H+-transporting ATPase subunit b